MYSILFILCVCPSLLNPFGIFPLWIPFSLTLLLHKGYPLSFDPLLSLGAFAFLFLGFSSYIVNLDQSKVGHLIAYIVFFFYSIPLFKSLFARHVILKHVLSIIRVCSFVSFATLVFSIFFDYILLIIGINYADFIPSMTNVPVMSLFASRPRGFFPEPTDAAMALNVFYFLFLASNSALKKIFPSLLIPVYINLQLSFILFLISSFLLRSASSLVSILLGISLAIFLELLLSKAIPRPPLFLPKKRLVSSILALSVLLTLFSKFYHTITSTIFGLFLKISLSSESSSAVARSSSWLNNTLYYLNDSDLFSLIFGSGPGHVSLLAETDILQGSTNWYLDILIGFGFLGLTIYISLLLFVFSRSLNLIPPFRFWYTVALFSVHIHLFTNTGFYYPSLAFLISLSFLPALSNSKYVS